MINPHIQQTSNHQRPIQCQTQEIQMAKMTIATLTSHNLNNNIKCDTYYKKITVLSEHRLSVHYLIIQVLTLTLGSQLQKLTTASPFSV